MQGKGSDMSKEKRTGRGADIFTATAAAPGGDETTTPAGSETRRLHVILDLDQLQFLERFTFDARIRTGRAVRKTAVFRALIAGLQSGEYQIPDATLISETDRFKG